MRTVRASPPAMPCKPIARSVSPARKFATLRSGLGTLQSVLATFRFIFGSRGSPSASHKPPEMESQMIDQAYTSVAESRRFKILPDNWEKRVLVAYLRMIGASWKTCAAAVGVSDRTVYNWQSDPTWPDAIREARLRWHTRMEEKSRAALIRAVERYAEEPREASRAARWYLERTDSALAPAPVQHRHAGPEGGPLQVIVGAIPAGFVRDKQPS